MSRHSPTDGARPAPQRRTVALRRVTVLAMLPVLFAVTGCASDCNMLGSMSTRCNVELVAGAILIAPVALPIIAVQDALEKHRDEREERRMKAGVEASNLPDSETCVLKCSDYEEERIKAAARVIEAYGADSDADGRKLALLMAAHKRLADALWKKNPPERLDHLLSAAHAAESPAMWAFVRREGNTLPKNDNYFTRLANEIVIEVLLIQQVARSSDAGADRTFACDTVPFATLIQMAHLNAGSVCDSVRERWSRYQARAGVPAVANDTH